MPVVGAVVVIVVAFQDWAAAGGFLERDFVFCTFCRKVSVLCLSAGVSSARLVLVCSGLLFCSDCSIVNPPPQILGALAGAGLATIFLDSTSGGFNALADGIDVSTAIYEYSLGIPGMQ